MTTTPIYVYSTSMFIEHYAGDSLKLSLYTDLQATNETLEFDDIIAADLTVRDYNDVVVLTKSTGVVFNNGIPVTNNGNPVYNTSPDFSYNSGTSRTLINIREGETEDFLPGAYTVEVVLKFKNGETITYLYEDALQILSKL